MLKINDNRDTHEVRLCDIDLNGFFEFDDILCRRVVWGDAEMEITPKRDNEIVAIQMYGGCLVTLDRDAWVKPLADRQITLELED